MYKFLINWNWYGWAGEQFVSLSRCQACRMWCFVTILDTDE